MFKFRGSGPDVSADTSGDLRPAAAVELEAFMKANPAPFERAERLRERAERTGTDGTPSESAGLRAIRAREEALAAIVGVRAAFVDAHGAGAAEAFDLEFEARYPMVAADPEDQDDVIEP